MTGGRPGRRTAALAAVCACLAGCEPAERAELPDAAQLQEVYGADAALRLNGNVVEVEVRQDPQQLARGGSVWAKAGPYIYLFTPQTQRLFEDFGGVGGVRVTTVDRQDRFIARAMLERGTLNSVTWRRAINVAGRARTEATRRPNLMITLTDYGEEHTEFEYSERYARPTQ